MLVKMDAANAGGGEPWIKGFIALGSTNTGSANGACWLFDDGTGVYRVSAPYVVGDYLNITYASANYTVTFLKEGYYGIIVNNNLGLVVSYKNINDTVTISYRDVAYIAFLSRENP